MITSDSHGKDLAYFLDQASDSSYNITNHCQPGAPLEFITEPIRQSAMVKKLTTNDFAILIGGTNNVTKQSAANPAPFLQLLEESLKEMQTSLKHTNLILSTLPYRYDLSASSMENKLIKEANSTIRQITYN